MSGRHRGTTVGIATFGILLSHHTTFGFFIALFNGHFTEKFFNGSLNLRLFLFSLSFLKAAPKFSNPQTRKSSNATTSAWWYPTAR